MNCTKPVPSGSSRSPIRPVVTRNQAAAIAAGLVACPVSAKKLPIQFAKAPVSPRTPRPGPASRKSHPSPHQRLNRADNRPKEGHA